MRSDLVFFPGFRVCVATLNSSCVGLCEVWRSWEINCLLDECARILRWLDGRPIFWW